MQNQNIKIKLKNLTKEPGVYKMLDKLGNVIYVGKAKNLKNRVSNYFIGSNHNAKTQLLQKNIDDFSIIITKTETQALLLENELIKQFKPKFNILLKDSKSYPYIYLSNDAHPRLGMYRGKKNKNYHYFGPYPSSHIARDALALLKKIFKVRQCTNSFYRARSRPCLEYQIGLCSAPCVGKISDIKYEQDVDMVSLFLNGKASKLLNQVSQKMKDASIDLDFEAAAKYRDQLIGLRTIQERHGSQFSSDMDVVSVVNDVDTHCIEVVFVRGGKQVGSETFFPKNAKNDSCEEVLCAFLPLYYLGTKTPKEIVLSHKLEDKSVLETGLFTKLIQSPRVDKKHYLEMATLNAK
jgi:excinuclease ABC subunit C